MSDAVSTTPAPVPAWRHAADAMQWPEGDLKALGWLLAWSGEITHVLVSAERITWRADGVPRAWRKGWGPDVPPAAAAR